MHGGRVQTLHGAHAGTACWATRSMVLQQGRRCKATQQAGDGRACARCKLAGDHSLGEVCSDQSRTRPVGTRPKGPLGRTLPGGSSCLWVVPGCRMAHSTRRQESKGGSHALECTFPPHMCNWGRFDMACITCRLLSGSCMSSACSVCAAAAQHAAMCAK